MTARAIKQASSFSPTVGNNSDADDRIRAFKELFKYQFTLDDNNRTTLALKLKQLMEQRMKMSTQKLAERASLEPNVCYRILRGDTKHPSLETILNLCIALQVSVKDRDELLRLAGKAWDDSELHAAYRYILDKGNIFLGGYSCIQTVADFNNAFIALELEGFSEPPLTDHSVV